MSLDVREGEFVALIGPSGCGKSTLFNIIGGLIDDYDRQRPRRRRAHQSAPHRDIGMVFQEESTFPWRTTLDNVAFPLEARRHAESRVARSARAPLHPARRARGVREPLSGRALGRHASAHRARAHARLRSRKILLMDEPFASLDEQTRLLLGDKLLQIQAALKQTTLLITHNIAEAVQLSRSRAVMSYRPGRIKRIVEIDLPRPRDLRADRGAEFGRYVAQIWEDLREEAAAAWPKPTRCTARSR